MARKNYMAVTEESCKKATAEGSHLGAVIKERLQQKPLVLIAASYREAQDWLKKRATGAPDRQDKFLGSPRVHVVTPTDGPDRLRGWRSADCDIEYALGWDRTTGQGAAYKRKVQDLKDYLAEAGWKAG